MSKVNVSGDLTGDDLTIIRLPVSGPGEANATEGARRLAADRANAHRASIHPQRVSRLDWCRDVAPRAISHLLQWPFAAEPLGRFDAGRDHSSQSGGGSPVHEWDRGEPLDSLARRKSRRSPSHPTRTRRARRRASLAPGAGSEDRAFGRSGEGVGAGRRAWGAEDPRGLVVVRRVQPVLYRDDLRLAVRNAVAEIVKDLICLRDV